MIFKTAAEIASKMSRSSFSGHLVEYKVVVVTGSERHSGTDSCVFVKLVGDGGDSGEVELEKSENFNKFEKGQVDTFTFHSKVALGRVQQVFVRIDSSGNLVKKNWLLKSIEVSGGDLAGAVEFNHGAVLTPENPTAVLVLPASEGAAGASGSLLVSTGSKRNFSKKGLQRTGKAAHVSEKSVFGPAIQSLLPSVSEVPTCYTVNSGSGCLVVG